MQYICAHIPICSHPWSHYFFSYTLRDQALHLQNMHKHKTSLLPFCYITKHHIYARCATAVLLLHVLHAFHICDVGLLAV